MANPKRRQERARRRRRQRERAEPAEKEGESSAATATAPAIPPILRWMAEQVEANKFSPMMLFAGTMQMVHMERQLQDAGTDAEQKEAYTEIIRGRVSSDVVKVFVQQCFHNAHPEQAAAGAAAQDETNAAPARAAAAGVAARAASDANDAAGAAAEAAASCAEAPAAPVSP